MIKTVVIVSHKYVTQPDDELAYYLSNKKYQDVLHIRHSFGDYPDRKSYYTWYKNGLLHKEVSSKDYVGLPEVILYAKELYFTVLWVFTSGLTFDLYVGMDGLCVLFGNILKLLGKVKITAFWAMDFVPSGRFHNSIKEKIYHFINYLGYKYANEMWDISPRMIEARTKSFNISPDIYRNHKVVPYGVWLDKIPFYSYEDCDKDCIVFMGHLIEKQGVQLIIKSLKKISEVNPNVKFKIIGGGSYLEALKSLASELNVLDKCQFMGRLPDHDLLQKEIALCCIAVAPYVKELDTWTYYADPGKVKEYIACGVPVLLTPLPWNTSEIVQRGCGEVITEDINDISSKILDMMTAAKNKDSRKKCREYAVTFDYGYIFDKLFKDA